MPSRSASRSEGEYLSSDSDAKATKPPPKHRNYNVDRLSRHDASARSRYSRSRSRSRSPYRASRGEKRRREDEVGVPKNKPRTFRARYENIQSAEHPRRDRLPKRSRTYSPDRSRSPSPYRRPKENALGANRNSPQSVSINDKAQKGQFREHEAKTSDQASAHTVGRDNQVTVLPDTTSVSPLDEASLIEARRKRREAIKNKFRGHEPSLLVQALHVGSEPIAAEENATSERSVSPAPVTVSTSAPGTPRSVLSEPPSPRTPANANPSGYENDEVDSPQETHEASAADYDPTIDMQEERARHDKSMFKEDEKSQEKAARQVEDKVESAQKGSDNFDMFADDDDMFAASPPIKQIKDTVISATTVGAGIDNFDDPEGYYLTILGEIMENRYRITQNLGRGMFATVVRAVDVSDNRSVAIKIIRSNDSMRKAGLKEIEILQNLAANDPDDRMNVVRLLRWFDHKGHMCMVFENLSMNLREVLKKYGREEGISLKSIRAYALQLFRALGLLRKCQILHADLKPDNILINESRSAVKICDLGSASPISENAIAPYLVSRFYRAPEIVLGINYDYGIDMWSIGCTLFELYTGKILFTGRNNNNMLKTVMECRGKFPNKMLRKGELTYDYFDDLFNFKSTEPDKITGKMITKWIDVKAKPVRDLKSRLIPKGKRLDEQERKELETFADLLDKCLQLSPEKRITPNEALRHPFLNKTK